MVDIPGNTTSTATFLGDPAVGATFSGELDFFADSDWIRVTLTAGVTYSFYGSVESAGAGGGDSDLRILDSTGDELAANDNDPAGATVNSFIEYTPDIGGTYFVEISAGNNSAGLYSVVVTAAPFINNRLSESDDVLAVGANQKIIGDKGDDTITIGSPSETALGEQGDDFISGSDSANFLAGGLGNDTLRGFGGDDTIFGDPGLDFILGGTGNDLLYGGDGADRLFGDAGFDTLKGGDGGDHIDGGTENDAVYGEGGADVLHGGSGADALIGGAGADVMTGGSGNDTFQVDNIGDTTAEGVGFGTDTVLTSISYALVAGYEIEKFSTISIAATTAINLTGNEFSQRIDGNGGNNIFQGAGGNDTVVGYNGNDRLRGDAGQDMLYGNTGNDVLVGGSEVDYFIFNTTPNASTNRDTVMDFVHGGDKFWMENSVFVALGGVGALNAGFFRLGTAAADADDHIIYDMATGNLLWDSNGVAAGGAVQFATLASKPILSAGDFVVV